MRSCQLPVASCQLPVASCQLPVAGCQLPVASCRLPVAGCQLPGATCSDETTEEFVHRHCPGVEIRGHITGTGSAWSIATARRLVGYALRHSWRDKA